MDLLIIILSLVALIIGSYTDLKTREVPDWVNYGFIFIGIGVNAIYSIINWSFTPILQSISGFVLFFIIALLMYYSGQWGGGDSKMLMALGGLIGLEFIWNSFLVEFFIMILLVGAIYGLGWAFGLLFKNKNAFIKEFKKQFKVSKLLHILFIVLALIILTLSLLFETRIIIFSLIIYLLFYIWILVKAIEEACMIKSYNVSKLTEGDWIVKEIKIKGKHVVGPKDLGITYTQIELLKKHKIKKVLVKEGIPFVPSFLIAYAIMLIIYYSGSSLFSFF